MALVKTDDVVLPSRGFNGLSLMRQLGLMIGLAASVAIGVAIVQWSQDPSYRMLYSNLTEQDSGEIANSLQQAAIPYKVDTNTGAILVAGESVHEARLKLASEGLPRGGGVGFEMLDKDQGFGVSQFMEGARYQRALEGELARTIGSLNNVRGARVHLAIPKQTAFARARKKPKASVTVDLFAGRALKEGQITAISHMVAASIPSLEADDVTVIDQKGRLLTSPESSADMRISSTQFDHRKRLEDYYIKRIEGILTPIMGDGRVRAQVSAEIDFTVTEQTQESFNPDLPAIRSEQTLEERRTSGNALSGVPGSLTNQVPENAVAGEAQDNTSAPLSSTTRTTRNYELDRTISHIRTGGGDIKRLSVAVVLDDKRSVDENGETVRSPLTEEEIAQISSLVKEAIGFSGQRGDSVNVINASFMLPEALEPLPEPSFMDNPGLWDTGKQVLAGAVVFFLLFGVLRPVLKELAAKGEVIPPQGMMPAPGADGIQSDQLTLSGGEGSQQKSYDDNLTTAKTLASQDPKRVAQVVNNWVATDGG